MYAYVRQTQLRRDIPTGLLEASCSGTSVEHFTGAIAQKVGRFRIGPWRNDLLDEVGKFRWNSSRSCSACCRNLGIRTAREHAHHPRRYPPGRRHENRDLATLVEEQRFRGDLYYRLNVFPLNLPPLRDDGRHSHARGISRSTMPRV